jgi:hypothetical protein
MQRMVVVSLVLGMLVVSTMGGATSAQEIPDLPGEPDVAVCPIIAVPQGGNCFSGEHKYKTIVSHSFTGSFYASIELSTPTVTSRLSVEDGNGGWTTVHTVTCSAPTFVGMPANPLECEESGVLPEPGQTFQHRCNATRAVTGVVLCSLVTDS